MTYLLVPEAAEKLRMSRRQVTVLCAKGELRASKPAHQWLIDPADLQDFMDEKANRPRRKRRSRAA